MYFFFNYDEYIIKLIYYKDFRAKTDDEASEKEVVHWFDTFHQGETQNIEALQRLT